MDIFNDEASSPALESQPVTPSAQIQQQQRAAKMADTMKKLAWMRQGHDGPEVGTRYNLPTQAGF